MRGRSAIPTCSFCGTGRDEVELLFRSPLGGCHDHICDRCVRLFGEAVRLNDLSPQLAATLVEALNKGV